MKQTRWLSEFSCLSEYTRLYPISQDGPGLCFCSEFGVSVWKSDLDRVNPGWVVRSSEKGPGITLVWQVPNSAGSPNSKPAEPGFSPVPLQSSESKLRIQTPNQGSTLFFLRTPNLQSKGSSRSFLRTLNQNSELRVKHSPGPNRYLLHGLVGHAQQLRILKHEHTVSHFSYAPLIK